MHARDTESILRVLQQDLRVSHLQQRSLVVILAFA
jgi:hypothetical protein